VDAAHSSWAVFNLLFPQAGGEGVFIHRVDGQWNTVQAASGGEPQGHSILDQMERVSFGESGPRPPCLTEVRASGTTTRGATPIAQSSAVRVCGSIAIDYRPTPSELYTKMHIVAPTTISCRAACRGLPGSRLAHDRLQRRPSAPRRSGGRDLHAARQARQPRRA
jgi:hypothetical protein